MKPRRQRQIEKNVTGKIINEQHRGSTRALEGYISLPSSPRNDQVLRFLENVNHDGLFFIYLFIFFIFLRYVAVSRIYICDSFDSDEQNK